ncbi:GNAT family N-acetyltransferase [Lacrimispora sp.]|uniref:GNAT family N-acetyltransferase n=1 Tax=Lacrimispora sp. TaxID=2719234 RepID=UPI0028AF3577|nr:GNAT family protein [Lacrimispora sp.]
MNLESERIIIRDLKLEDASAFINMASDGSLIDIFGDCSECSRWMNGRVKEAISMYSRNDPYCDYLAYSIVNKKNNQVVGSGDCSAYQNIHKIGITYFIDKNHRNYGYVTEAIMLFTKCFLNKYDVSKLIATIRTENVASCKAIEKAGYELKETKMYKDINDTLEQKYNFYFFNKSMI